MRYACAGRQEYLICPFSLLQQSWTSLVTPLHQVHHAEKHDSKCERATVEEEDYQTAVCVLLKDSYKKHCQHGPLAGTNDVTCLWQGHQRTFVPRTSVQCNCGPILLQLILRTFST